MQCKDIPTKPILEFLLKLNGEWAFRYGIDVAGDRSILHAFPPDVPEKLVLAKMKNLMLAGLVSGCGCGCRGDFVLTIKGRNWLEKGIVK